MIFLYTVPNRNPSLGPVEGDKQQVSVYDSKLGNNRTVITTPEEADLFIDTRNQVINSAAKRGWGLAGLATAAGAGIGAGVNRYFDVKNAKQINALIDPLNKTMKDLLDSGKSVLVAKLEALGKDEFKNLQWELREVFSEDTKMFKAIDIKSVAKRAMKMGALGGAALAACFAVAIPFIKADRADRKITQEFIDYNK